jgi:hypothetical protein
MTSHEFLFEHGSDIHTMGNNDNEVCYCVVQPKDLIAFAKLKVEEAFERLSKSSMIKYHTVCEDGTTKGVFNTQQEALDLANKLNETSNLYHDYCKLTQLGGGMDLEGLKTIVFFNLK